MGVKEGMRIRLGASAAWAGIYRVRFWQAVDGIRRSEALPDLASHPTTHYFHGGLAGA